MYSTNAREACRGAGRGKLVRRLVCGLKQRTGCTRTEVSVDARDNYAGTRIVYNTRPRAHSKTCWSARAGQRSTSTRQTGMTFGGAAVVKKRGEVPAGAKEDRSAQQNKRAAEAHQPSSRAGGVGALSSQSSHHRTHPCLRSSPPSLAARHLTHHLT